MFDELWNISPVDGRYAGKTSELRNIAGEAALIRYRLQVEIEWFIALSEEEAVTEFPELSDELKEKLRAVYLDFKPEFAVEVKKIEETTNHDVKAIEYFLRQYLGNDLSDAITGFIHFACTSEDINSAAYGLMIRDLTQLFLNTLDGLEKEILDKIKRWKAVPMLARTHGQPASPTTLGKEFLVFLDRLMTQEQILKDTPFLVKMSGAVGNYNAHYSAYPQVKWDAFSRKVIEDKLGLTQNILTTQIEPHDYMAEIFDTLSRTCSILIDFSRDIWIYISINYFSQKSIRGEVGSSTMPHKINPIDFENAEGNLLLARAQLRFFSDKLPISRMQRDLTDSTTLRNIGTAFAHLHIALLSLMKGLNKIDVNEMALKTDLDKHWEILAEPVQTVMRRYGLPEPYEQLKAFTRGKKMDENGILAFIIQLEIPETAKKELLALTPDKYTGIAEDIVDRFLASL